MNNTSFDIPEYPLPIFIPTSLDTVEEEPVSCTAAQFYAELNKRGWLATAEAYVNSVASSQPLVYIWWNKSQAFVSDSPMLIQAAQGLFGLNKGALRELIIDAQANSPTL
jgi:tRNA U34 5-methylaminomethyl-2-thiouridine-forming methyltransferase MnmC